MIEGYDISAHQRETPDLAGVGFVFCRATYGADPDARYAQHATAVRAAGKVLGAYHFARPASIEPVADQVAAFLTAAAGADVLWFDREADKVRNPDGTERNLGTISVTASRKFIAAVHATGRQIGLYCSESGYRDDLGADFYWIANWSREPQVPWDVWQYDNGGEDGLDNNRFVGTRGDLLARLCADPREAALEDKVAGLTDLLNHCGDRAENLAREIDEHATAHRSMRAFEEAHP